MNWSQHGCGFLMCVLLIRLMFLLAANMVVDMVVVPVGGVLVLVDECFC